MIKRFLVLATAIILSGVASAQAATMDRMVYAECDAKTKTFTVRLMLTYIKDLVKDEHVHSFDDIVRKKGVIECPAFTGTRMWAQILIDPNFPQVDNVNMKVGEKGIDNLTYSPPMYDYVEIDSHNLMTEVSSSRVTQIGDNDYTVYSCMGTGNCWTYEKKL